MHACSARPAPAPWYGFEHKDYILPRNPQVNVSMINEAYACRASADCNKHNNKQLHLLVQCESMSDAVQVGSRKHVLAGHSIKACHMQSTGAYTRHVPL